MSQQVQAQFVRAAKKPGLEMIKVIIPGRKQEGEWADCPQNVKNFAGKAFQEGQAVILTAELANNKYNVSRIEPVGGAAPQAPAQQNYTPPAQQPPKQTYVPPVPNVGYMKEKTPQESAQIMRLSVYSSACQAVKALTGQVNVDTICDVIDKIYKRGLTNAQK